MRKSCPSILVLEGTAESCVAAVESDCRQSVTASPAKSSKMAFWMRVCISECFASRRRIQNSR